ncbi:DUF1501 domain-containing protein [Prosthecobacter sp. SYSU 5D2]|uniref:DUF1501 domain-containing protein n=1 Tax=Prosthecobacter sp. SYSU 5D2 TaxID=3134134 RepID=UPI0031FED68C
MKMHPNCQGNHLDLRSGASRRDFLYVGMLGGLGLTLPQMLRLQAAQKIADVESFSPIADSIIHIYLPGGMAQHESWDPKPFASPDYRGPYTPIKTSIPGEYVGEKFQNIAKIMDKLTVIRSMTHGEAAHERGTHNMFTGYRPSPAIKFPSFGSIISHEMGSRNNLPPYVAVPNMVAPDQGTGYMSSAYGPFALGSDPADKNFTVRDLLTPKDVDDKRFERRRSLLGTVDEHFRTAEKSDAITAMDSFYQAAYGLISSSQAREAFDLNKETDKLRDEYGRNSAGQRFLLARRLVEAGVRMVSVNYGSWDHHSNIKGSFDRQAPDFDKAFARLITDLADRGMLKKTLVMVSSEFGRTPKVNGTNGRDHWPRVFSVAMAGGGVKEGYIHGASDALGGEPDRDAVGPEDLAKTMYRLLGINGEKRIMSDGGRPVDIVNGGRVMNEWIA